MSYQEYARMTTANGDAVMLEGVKASGTCAACCSI
jgi:hypothetical protein